MGSLGSFTPISDFGEADWIGPHLERFLPHLDQMVFYADDCKDGSIDIINEFRLHHELGHKIKLYCDKKAGNDESFGRMFNECMWCLDTDLAWFLHPDMWVVNPEAIEKVKASKAIALYTHIESYAGEPDGQLLRIKGDGRINRWKNIYRLRNPNLGCHYYARYPGDLKEDCYFKAITGDSHVFMMDPEHYPYVVEDSGIKVLHFSDVRTYERRYFRMRRYSELQGCKSDFLDKAMKNHPRINFKPGKVQDRTFDFEPAEYPKEFLEARNKWARAGVSK